MSNSGKSSNEEQVNSYMSKLKRRLKSEMEAVIKNANKKIAERIK